MLSKFDLYNMVCGLGLVKNPHFEYESLDLGLGYS